MSKAKFITATLAFLEKEKEKHHPQDFQSLVIFEKR